MWSSPDVVGLFSNNLVSFSRNVVLRGLLFSLNVVWKWAMLWVRAVYVLGPLQVAKQNRPFRPPAKALGRKSQCEPLAEVILAKVEVGLSAQRIYQDLVEESGFSDSYESVKRFVRRLRATRPERIYRLECQPGEEVQLDFGLGAPIDTGQGKSWHSWVLRMVLSYSRKAYSEAVSRQDTETFLRCLENGLRSFGGCPLLLNLDNMKSAVLQTDWFDPEINPKLADFCPALQTACGAVSAR